MLISLLSSIPNNDNISVQIMQIAKQLIKLKMLTRLPDSFLNITPITKSAAGHITIKDSC